MVVIIGYQRDNSWFAGVLPPPKFKLMSSVYVHLSIILENVLLHLMHGMWFRYHFFPFFFEYDFILYHAVQLFNRPLSLHPRSFPLLLISVPSITLYATPFFSLLLWTVPLSWETTILKLQTESFVDTLMSFQFWIAIKTNLVYIYLYQHM